MGFSLENFGLQNIKTNCPSSLYLANTDEKPSPYDTGTDRTNSPRSMRHQGITMKDIKKPPQWQELQLPDEKILTVLFSDEDLFRGSGIHNFGSLSGPPHL